MILSNRFLQWWCYQLKTYDCDPALFMMQYLMDRFELNIEQRYWFCWIYANTYQVATSWVIFNEFPDFENVSLERLTTWQEKYKHHLPYQKDQKWLRGRLPETFAAYRDACPCGQEFMWNCHADNFGSAWRQLLSQDFPKFGRYTAWFYLQALNECCGHSFVAPELFLGDDSSKQPRKGLALAYGLGEDPRKEQYEWLEQFADELIEAAVKILANEPHLPVNPDRFSLETSLCSWSKLPRGSDGKRGRYLFYYLDRQAEDIQKTSQCHWQGIHWDALWEARSEMLLPGSTHPYVVTAEMDLFNRTGAFTSNESLQDSLDLWYHNNAQRAANV